MKVNIAFSIELNDIPIEIAKRVGEVKNELYLVEKDIEEIKKLLADGNVSSALPKFNQWRELLINLDQKMSEYSIILAEYLKAIGELHTAKEEVNQITQSTESSLKSQLESNIPESQEVQETNE